jgi:hypothetical protein
MEELALCLPALVRQIATRRKIGGHAAAFDMARFSDESDTVTDRTTPGG